MNKTEFIKDEYYYLRSNNVILKWGTHRSDALAFINCDTRMFKRNGGNFHDDRLHYIPATPEQKHWLDECIRLNTFITKELAMETFKPEFVLPEKWVLHVDIANLELAKSFIHNHKNDYKGYRGSWTISLDGIPCYLHYPQVPDSNAHSSFQIQKDYVEITTEQFKKYVIKQSDELVQPAKDASIEEILEYCKKKYPIGIEIKSVYNTLGTCSSIAYIQDKRSIFIESETKNKSLCIYSGAVNKYATIIEPVKQESPIKLAEQGHKLYSLEEITKALTKEYDKVDVEDILKVIKTIK